MERSLCQAAALFLTEIPSPKNQSPNPPFLTEISKTKSQTPSKWQKIEEDQKSKKHRCIPSRRSCRKSQIPSKSQKIEKGKRSETALWAFASWNLLGNWGLFFGISAATSCGGWDLVVWDFRGFSRGVFS
jgi:hypothetical protein